MKVLSVILLSVLLFISCNQTKNNNAKVTNEKKGAVKDAAQNITIDTTFNFENYEVGKIPPGWAQYYTGKVPKTDWKIVDDNGNKVLAQLSEQNLRGHFNEIVYDGLAAKNVELSVRIKGIKGKRDQGGGFVWRFIDANNHYIVRENPLEDNVVLYKMENGVRTDLPLVGKGRTYGVDVAPLGNGWNDLKLIVVDDLFTVYLNGKQLFQVKDETFKNAGKVGLWTKADAVSYFDDFQVKSIK
ncbi:hypothetical protein MNBD_IGNAVI01-564 [hydrothermal vent metagenome]|uniref:3-keto-disaccharide hydrolase domain-containing protein n=1 Tax=hydrothermal vent metagenome TaxID=652676 RepID=A0A3B1C162_9ZZZZ